MSLTLTDAARLRSQEVNVEPQIVFEIDGVPTKYGSASILKYACIGDENLYIGDDWIIGGYVEIDDQDDLITLEGTTTSISQQLHPDKALGSSISNMQVALVDVDNSISELISPSLIIADVLGRRAKVKLGFQMTAYPDDFITVFRGIIDEVTAKQGSIVFNLSHPDQKKRQTLFQHRETTIGTASQSFVEADVDVGTNVITCTSHGLTEGDAIQFGSTGTLPAPLKKNQTYYASAVTTHTFQVAHDSGGAALDLTTDGSASATHSLIKGGITAAVGTIPVTSTAGFLVGVLGPSGVQDPSMRFYIRIDDELIEYTGISGNSFTGCVRGSLGTAEEAHAASSSVSSFYRLTGTAMELALKIMMSGWQAPFQTGVAIKHFQKTSSTTEVTNAIFFDGINVQEEYGLALGDYVTTTGASNGANNVTLMVIDGFETNDEGSYIIIDGVSFVTEVDTAGVIAFRSQYDTLPEGCKMYGDEVDVNEHQVIHARYLSSFNYDFYLKEEINAKDFIEQELYLPSASYSIPRKAQSSVGYHVGPIPGSNIKVLDDTSIKEPGKIQLRRSLSKNFYNTIIYKFDDYTLDDKFLTGVVTTDNDSRTRIPVGTRALVVPSKGMRSSLGAVSMAGSASNRKLNRYKFGAEFFENIEVLYGDSFNIEVGDIIILDPANLKITDTRTGGRGGAARMYECMNKTFDIKTGKVKLSLTDTSFSTSARYCLISPASEIEAGYSNTQFQIRESFGSRFGVNEYLKWERYPGLVVKVRNADFSVMAESEVDSFSGNLVTLTTSLGFTPTEGMIMELAQYNEMTQALKLIYGFMDDGGTFDDGAAQYSML